MKTMTTKEEIRYAKKIADGSFTAPRGEKKPPRKFVQLRPIGLWFLFSRWRG